MRITDPIYRLRAFRIASQARDFPSDFLLTHHACFANILPGGEFR